MMSKLFTNSCVNAQQTGVYYWSLTKTLCWHFCCHLVDGSIIDTKSHLPPWCYVEPLTCQLALCINVCPLSYGPYFLVFSLILVMLIAKQPLSKVTCSIFIKLLKYFLSLGVNACAPDFSRLINISAAVYSRYKSPMFNSYLERQHSSSVHWQAV